jgi:hypothetical protein
MLRRFVLAVAVMALTFTFAFSDTINVGIFKVDGNKITYKKATFNKTDMKIEYGDAVVATVKSDAKVTKKGKKKGDPDVDVEGGLKSDVLTAAKDDAPVSATLTTPDGDPKTVTAIQVKGGKKKKMQ